MRISNEILGVKGLTGTYAKAKTRHNSSNEKEKKTGDGWGGIVVSWCIAQEPQLPNNLSYENLV